MHVRTDDGFSISYRVTGSGPHNLIFLHAWGGFGGYFDQLIEHLDPSKIRSITMDMRGHGDSDKRDADITFERFARDVFSVADAARADRFVAVGVSMGGKLAQFLTVVDPARVAGLVLVASPSAAELPLPAEVRAWPNLAGDARALIDRTVRPFMRKHVDQEVLRRYGEAASRIPKPYLEGTIQMVATTSFIEHVHSVHVPVLVITSDDDLHGPAENVARSFADARMRTIDSGTEIPIEAPSKLAQLISEFVAELPG